MFIRLVTDAGIKSNPNFSKVSLKVAKAIFPLKMTNLKVAQKVDQMFYKRLFVAKNFQKSPNLVTLITTTTLTSNDNIGPYH